MPKAEAENTESDLHKKRWSRKGILLYLKSLGPGIPYDCGSSPALKIPS